MKSCAKSWETANERKETTVSSTTATSKPASMTGLTQGLEAPHGPEHTDTSWFRSPAAAEWFCTADSLQGRAAPFPAEHGTCKLPRAPVAC